MSDEKVNGVVLVVEDEPILRLLAVDLVEEAGLQAIEASNADAAITVLESRDDICVLFTDIDMPAGSMNGLRLAEAVFNRWPPIRIIIVSGHYKAAEHELPKGSVFFSKPYANDAVMAQLKMFATAA